MPIIAIDFSKNTSHQKNEILKILHMIANSYSNVTNLAIFGFGAKTSIKAAKASGFFPLSRRLRNPFTPNDSEILNQTFDECINAITRD